MRLRSIAFFLLLTVHTVQAQAGIHADFAVSQGDNSLGTFRVRLDFDKAPRTCANFIGLATGQRPWIDEATGEIRKNSPFYDGLTFHRLIHSFVIQCGSPDGSGADGPGFSIQDEYHADLRHSGRYILSMAKDSRQDSGGSQFFITLRATPSLDDKHSVFGEVILGQEIIDSFTDEEAFPTDQDDVPITPITIDLVTVGGDDLASFDIDDPALKLPQLRTIRYKDIAADLPNDVFSVTFDRGFQTEFFSHESSDLNSWAPIARLLSLSQFDNYEFPLTELDPDKFFLRMIAVDYGSIHNFSANSIRAGSSFTLSNRAGSSFTIHLGVQNAHTWSDSQGNSGAISFLSVRDLTGSSGLKSHPNGAAPELSHISILAIFPTPAGERQWTSLETDLSFHDPTSGWTDGIASGVLSPEAVYNSFIFAPSTPAP